jgi:hypothetical protein
MSMDAATTVDQVEPRVVERHGPPYAPSVLDRLVYRIDRLPGHGWWLYPLLLVAFLGWIHAWIWAWGVRPVGTFEPGAWTYVFYGPFALAAIHFLDRAGNQAMAVFRPALDMTDTEIEDRRYELVTLRAGRTIWLIVAVGVAIGLGVAGTQAEAALALFSRTRAEGLFIVVPFAVLGYMGFAALIWHTFRQLRLVAQLHREARLDLFDTGPIYAFSGLTMRTGLVWITVGYYSLTVSGAFVTDNPVALPVSLFNFVVAAACFVLPLYGLHGRLVVEKARLLHDAAARVEAMRSALYGRVDSRELTGIKEVTDAYTGVIAARDQVLKLPTWPWPPRALGQFATALILPIVIYVVSRLVGQQFGA